MGLYIGVIMLGEIKIKADAVFKKILTPSLCECANTKCKWNRLKSKFTKEYDREPLCKLSYMSLNKDGKCNEFEEIE